MEGAVEVVEAIAWRSCSVVALKFRPPPEWCLAREARRKRCRVSRSERVQEMLQLRTSNLADFQKAGRLAEAKSTRERERERADMRAICSEAHCFIFGFYSLFAALYGGHFD